MTTTVAELQANLILDISQFKAASTEATRQLDQQTAAVKKTGDALKTDLGGAATKAASSLGDTTKATTEFQRSLGTTKDTLTQVSSALGQVGVDAGILERAFSVLTSPMAVVVAGLGGVMLAARLGADAMIENANEVRRLMAVSGLGAEAADDLGDA